ncbi:tetraacyldisaccharide 4'-kinase [Burkholderiales bacterium JOSHI_001]|nr:tetraacyldisaccharide 4'-kinase [Burkholderiales bacterium JOSHI_001]
MLAQTLRPLSWLYSGLEALHRASYALGLRHAQRLPVPVLVVGNLVAGGAGKTPVVMHLVQALRQRGWRPGVVARGHGAQAAGGPDATLVHRDTPAAMVGDEPLLVHLRCGVPVAVARERVKAALALLIRHPELNLVIADDGLQHHALARDAQVIVFDARGVGNGLRLPAGPLREAFAATPPPRSVVLYSAGAPSTAWPGFVAQRRLAGAVALADWWQGAPARPEGLAALRGRPLLAAAGLARPQGFFDMLAAQGLSPTTLPLPDHHPFSTLPWPADTPDVVVTEKDAVKLAPDRCGSTRVWVATLDCEPEPAFDAAVSALLPPPKPEDP